MIVLEELHGFQFMWWWCWMGRSNNGGFGMMIDGSKDSDKKIESMLHWMLIMVLLEEAGQE